MPELCLTHMLQMQNMTGISFEISADIFLFIALLVTIDEIVMKAFTEFEGMQTLIL